MDELEDLDRRLAYPYPVQTSELVVIRGDISDAELDTFNRREGVPALGIPPNWPPADWQGNAFPRNFTPESSIQWIDFELKVFRWLRDTGRDNYALDEILNDAGLVIEHFTLLGARRPPKLSLEWAARHHARTELRTVREWIASLQIRERSSVTFPKETLGGPNANNTQRAGRFQGGVLAFFVDRVELCGAVILTGGKSDSARRILELLARKNATGEFPAFSGKKLSDAAHVTSGQDGVAGMIRRLRRQIEKVLDETQVIGGHDEVILSGGPGYRLSTKLTVQFVDEPAEATRGGANATESVASVATQSVAAAASHSVAMIHPSVVTGGPHAVAAARRHWILEQIAAGRELDAGGVAKELGCSLRASQRDLAAVKKAHGSRPTS